MGKVLMGKVLMGKVLMEEALIEEVLIEEVLMEEIQCIKYHNEKSVYQIQLAQPEHIEQITAITSAEALISTATASYTNEPLTRWEQAYQSYHLDYPWLVAVDPTCQSSQEVIGYAKASPYNIRDGFRWSVELSVYVIPRMKGKSVGIGLYQTLFRMLKIQGYQRVYARIALPNPASERLHQHFGLIQTGLLPEFAWKFGRWYDMAIYTGVVESQNRETEPPAKICDVSSAWQHLIKLETLTSATHSLVSNPL